MEKDHLLKKIEQNREKMLILSQTTKLTSRCMLEQSHKLDQLLNTYQTYYQSKK